MYNPFNSLIWLIMCVVLFALMLVMTAAQIIRAVFVFHDGFCAWYIPMAVLPIIGALLVKAAWNEYKEDK